MRRLSAAVSLVIGLALVWLVAAAHPGAASVALASEDACRFTQIEPGSSETPAGTIALPRPVYTAGGELQIAAWPAELEGPLLVHTLPESGRQAIEVLAMETGQTTRLSERNLSPGLPRWGDGTVWYSEWSPALSAGGSSNFTLFAVRQQAGGGWQPPVETNALSNPFFDLGSDGQPVLPQDPPAALIPAEAGFPQIAVRPGGSESIVFGEGYAVLTGSSSPCRLDLGAVPSEAGPRSIWPLQARWSPDGRRLALIVSADSGISAHGHGAYILRSWLVLLDFDRRTRTDLVAGQATLTDLAWSPDGLRIAALSEHVKQGDPESFAGRELLMIDAETAQIVQLLTAALGGGSWGTQLAWSADGRQLAVNCPTQQSGRVCVSDVATLESAADGAGDQVGEQSAVVGPVLEPIVQPSEESSSGSGRPLDSANPLSYTVPTTITVEMYWLTSSGSRRMPLTLCDPAHTAYGCTAFCSESGYTCPLNPVFPYPYMDSTIEVSLEKDYLPDVVPVELGPYYAAVALQAQAVAARTYAIYYVENPPGSPFNNSTSFQAFIPRAFERVFPPNYPNDPDDQWDDPCGADYNSLNTSQKKVCDALANPLYLSYSGDLPIRAQFAADAYASTDSGSAAYEIGVPEPISTACDADDYGHRKGMSQEGASRWARGHECSWSGAPILPGNAPGGPWSVAWTREQILVHYYSGVHLRDTTGVRTTPEYRWSPLNFGWGGGAAPPPVLLQPINLTLPVYIQNTGAQTWATGDVASMQVWDLVTTTYTAFATLGPSFAPGGTTVYPLQVSLPVTLTQLSGPITLTLDLALADGSGGWIPFSGREPALAWIDYTFHFQAVLTTDWFYLPAVFRP